MTTGQPTPPCTEPDLPATAPADVLLVDGSVAVVRPLRSDDRAALLALLDLSHPFDLLVQLGQPGGVAQEFLQFGVREPLHAGRRHGGHKPGQLGEVGRVDVVGDDPG